MLVEFSPKASLQCASLYLHLLKNMSQAGWQENKFKGLRICLQPWKVAHPRPLGFRDALSGESYKPWYILGCCGTCSALHPGILTCSFLSELVWSRKAASISSPDGGIMPLHSVISPSVTSTATRPSATSSLFIQGGTLCPLRIIQEWSQTDSSIPTTPLDRNQTAFHYPACHSGTEDERSLESLRL